MDKKVEIAKKVLDLFEGDEDLARYWAAKPNLALGGLTPDEFIQTEDEQALEDLIGRLEHGVFS